MRLKALIMALAVVLAAGSLVFFRPARADGPGPRAAPAPRSTAAAPKAPGPRAARPAPWQPTERQVMVMHDMTAAFEHSRADPQYAAIENLHDGCGYTAGWIGFCTATGDLLALVTRYNAIRPGNALAKYTERLRLLADAGSDRVNGLGGGFAADWRHASADLAFRRAQLDVGHDHYLAPAIAAARREGITTALGLEHLFDTALQNGPSAQDCAGMPQTVRRTNKVMGGNPAHGVSERSWLLAYNQIRTRQLLRPCEPGRAADWPESVDRVAALSELVRAGNWQLTPPVRLGSDVRITITRPAD
ncbi:MAG TPA: chitosanase [Streptosporangiaceae bacterium]|nr:chitosanase [Streptosporangiaceae bacterium]